MTRHNALDYVDSTIERVGHASAWLFFLTFVIGVCEVVLRYVLDAPTSWVHVTSNALCVVAFAFGGSYAMVRGEHMRVTILSDRLQPSLRRASQWLAVFCGTVYLLGLCWGLAREAVDALWRFEAGRWTPELTTGAMSLPLPAFAKALLLLGALLFLLAVLIAAARLTTVPRQ